MTDTPNRSDTTAIQMVTCPECDGEGRHTLMSEFPVPCRTCKGARKVRWQVHFEHWLENRWWLKKKGNIEQLEAYLKAHPEMAT